MSTHAASGPAQELPARAREDRLLRLALGVDAVVSAANGLAYVLAAGALDSLLGLPASLLRPVGLFMIAYGALVWLIGTRRPIVDPAVAVVIGANASWVALSLVLVALDAFGPTTVGAAWLVLQALTVAAFAILQAVGLRRAR